MSENTLELTTVQEECATELETKVEKAFSKGLASVIMASFPIASIIAIFFGKQVSKMIANIDEYAAQTGTNAGGKRMAAKVLGIVGFATGIYYTAFWAMFGTFYLFYFLFIFIGIFANL